MRFLRITPTWLVVEIIFRQENKIKRYIRLTSSGEESKSLHIWNIWKEFPRSRLNQTGEESENPLLE
jgi:hypothetical protein